MRKSLYLVPAALAASLWVGSAQATIQTFVGQDDGAPVGGPFPNSVAAQANFEAAAAAFGSLSTITYENLAVGFYSPIAAAPGVSIALSASTPNFGTGYSGINNSTIGNLYGFNTTPGGSKWLGFPGGSATFNFSTPTNSFGTFLTGLQTIFTTSVQITFVDGTSETLNAPVNVNGGVEYFGFTDTTAISSISITDLTTGNGTDAWGIDDTTYNAAAVTPTPEPASLALLGAALLGFGLVRRRNRSA